MSKAFPEDGVDNIVGHTHEKADARRQRSDLVSFVHRKWVDDKLTDDDRLAIMGAGEVTCAGHEPTAGDYERSVERMLHCIRNRFPDFEEEAKQALAGRGH